jgi:hypothetical protein
MLPEPCKDVARRYEPISANDNSQAWRGQDSGQPGLSGSSIDVEDRGTPTPKGFRVASGRFASAGLPE